ncbi:protein wntless homolog [Centruroides vittatus]|uniref:protein wntless homolog n=1 Tax=Centruroides vittatus TaxID=120091 RepID=UPI0035109881
MGFTDCTFLINSSKRSFATFISVLVLCQLTLFFLAGWIVPFYFETNAIMAEKCINNEFTNKEKNDLNAWHVIRSHNKNSSNCNNSIRITRTNEFILFDNVMFGAHIHLMKKASGWFLNSDVTILVSPEVTYKIYDHPVQYLKLNITIKLKCSKNKQIYFANVTEQKSFVCHLDSENHKIFKNSLPLYKCEPLFIFELSNFHYNYCLLNVYFPINLMDKINLDLTVEHFKNLKITTVTHNEKFLQFFLCLKLFCLVLIIIITVYYTHFIKQAKRSSVLLERMLCYLSILLILQNIPMEYLQHWFEFPSINAFILIFTELRKTLFYCMLFYYWIMYCNECQMIEKEYQHLKKYNKTIIIIFIMCFTIVIFNSYKKNIHQENPLRNVWLVESRTKLFLIFTFITMICSALYIIYLCKIAYHVSENIKFKWMKHHTECPDQICFEKRIYRFRIIMGITLLCAILTTVYFIINQIVEGYWKWNKIHLQHVSTFFIGVYGMWNLYIFMQMFLYSKYVVF